MDEPLRVSTPEPGVLLLELNRPEVHNALNTALVQQLQQQIAGIDDAVRAVVLTSTTTGTFCAGADLDITDEERAQVSDALYELLESVLTAPVPAIAALDGPTVGGGVQLLLGSDVRLGSPQARLRFVGLGHGLAVGTWALPAAGGMELLLSQRFLDAEQAAARGLLDRVVADPRAEALQLARATTATEPRAVRRAKEQLVRGHGLLQRLAEERAANAAAFTGAVPRK